MTSFVSFRKTSHFYILCLLLAYLAVSFTSAKSFRKLAHGNRPTILTAPGQPIPDDPTSSTYTKVLLTPSSHSDNWAVIMSTSKYWFNYRHSANALTLYRILRERGYSDDRIVLMIPEDLTCNPRNRFPGFAFNNNNHQPNLADDVEVDFRGDEVTFEALIEVLTGKQHPSTPSNKRIFPTKDSNVLLYIAGHGGDQFMKFQDQRVMTADDLSMAVQNMHALQRFKELFVLVDTCQAATFVQTITTPGVLWGSSSSLDENSYSHGFDSSVGVSLLDRLTYETIQFFNRYDETQVSLNDFIYAFRPDDLSSNPVFGLASYGRDVKRVPLSDFFVSAEYINSSKSPLVLKAIYPLAAPQIHYNMIFNASSALSGFTLEYTSRSNIESSFFIQDFLSFVINEMLRPLSKLLRSILVSFAFWGTLVCFTLGKLYFDTQISKPKRCD